MFKLFFLLIFVAISIYNEVSKSRKKAQQEAAQRRQAQHTDDEQPDPWDDILEDAQRSLNNQKDEDLEEERERIRRERDEILARKARERKMREEAERERRAFEEHQKAEALAAEQCVKKRMPEPCKTSSQHAKVYSQVEEGERSTVGSFNTNATSDKVGNLTPADARRAVILDAIFNRPNF